MNQANSDTDNKTQRHRTTTTTLPLTVQSLPYIASAAEQQKHQKRLCSQHDSNSSLQNMFLQCQCRSMHAMQATDKCEGIIGRVAPFTRMFRNTFPMRDN